MLKVRKFLLVSIVLLSLACGLFAQTLPGTQTPVQINTATAAFTSTPEATATLIPLATVMSTQVSTATASATIDSMATTLEAEMGSSAALTNISQYFHPVGTSLASWHAIPIMQQATAGQEFQANIYSYITAATLDQARQFYAGKAQSLGLTNLPVTGSAGSGSQATHSVTFLSYSLTIVLASYDNDPSHVIEVISTFP